MNEIEMLQRIDALEREIVALKGQKYEDMKQQAAERISDRYKLGDDYELLLESAQRHIEVGDTDTLSDVTARLEEELKSVCKRAGKPEPADSVGMITNWAQERARVEASDIEYSRNLEKLVFKGNV